LVEGIVKRWSVKVAKEVMGRLGYVRQVVDATRAPRAYRSQISLPANQQSLSDKYFPYFVLISIYFNYLLILTYELELSDDDLASLSDSSMSTIQGINYAATAPSVNSKCLVIIPRAANLTLSMLPCLKFELAKC